MVWSFDSTLLQLKDRVRFEVQDTIELEPLVQDEEIDMALTLHSNHVLRTAVYIAERVAIRFARQATMSTPDLRVEFGDRAKQYRELAKDLRQQMSRALPMPYAGGISVLDKQTVAANTDRVLPAFARGMHDDPMGTDEEGT